VICGGAPLGKELGEYFEALGIQILEGYGLTETCAPVAINRPGEIRFGTVGRPLPEVSVRIAEDGEILIRSRKLFRGYYKMPEETAAAFTQGWFRTGDVGHLDDDGYLRITDRKKDLIITSGGKNVAPQKIENLMKADPLIAECAVYGDRRHYLTAVLSLDPAALRDLAISRGIPATDPAVLCARPEIIAAVDERVKRCNARLASYETIKKFLLVPEEFSIENGALTPSQKLRRAVVHERYRARLEALYS
jgi:long-chain acyl-CoA synthetase